MRFDTLAILQSQRKAFSAITEPLVVHHTIQPNGDLKKSTSKNRHYVAPKLATSPAMLIQELPWVNTTQQFNFVFSISAPAQIPGTNNNIVIAKNDIFCIYGVQILLATGTNSADFVYRSHGVLPTDDAVYNSTVQFLVESSKYVVNMEGQFFRDNPPNANEYYGEMGLQIITPLRTVSGEQGTFTVSLNLKNPTAPLVISPNTLISMRLHGVYGQAGG